MTGLTVLFEGASVDVEAEVRNELALVDVDSIEAALGWELKPEGLCRGDVCVPVRDDTSLHYEGRVDLVAAAGVLGSTSLLDESAGVLAVAVPAGDRRAALVGRQAPDFTFADLDGKRHSLGAYQDRKRLLVAFASW